MAFRILLIISIMALTAGYALYQKKNLESHLAPSTKSEAVLAKLPTHTIFEALDGSPFSLDDFYQRLAPKLVVLHYWGTWCGPCEAELPELLSLIKRYADKPQVQFVLVAVNDEKIKIEKHLKTLVIPTAHITWLMDNKNVYRDLFGTTRVPETYVFSSDKTTLRKYVGPQEWNKTMFFQTFDEFLQLSTSNL